MTCLVNLDFMSVLFHTASKILSRLANNVNVTIVNWLCTPELSAAASSAVLYVYVYVIALPRQFSCSMTKCCLRCSSLSSSRLWRCSSRHLIVMCVMVNRMGCLVVRPFLASAIIWQSAKLSTDSSLSGSGVARECGARASYTFWRRPHHYSIHISHFDRSGAVSQITVLMLLNRITVFYV